MSEQISPENHRLVLELQKIRDALVDVRRALNNVYVDRDGSIPKEYVNKINVNFKYLRRITLNHIRSELNRIELKSK